MSNRQNHLINVCIPTDNFHTKPIVAEIPKWEKNKGYLTLHANVCDVFKMVYLVKLICTDFCLKIKYVVADKIIR